MQASRDLTVAAWDIQSTNQAPKLSSMLYAIALACDGLSGRALRKLPFLACVHGGGGGGEAMPIEPFLRALHFAVQHEAQSRAGLNHG